MKLFFRVGVGLLVVSCLFGDAEKAGQKEPVIVTEVVAKDGARVSIEVINLEHALFTLNGKSFKPNEAMNFMSHSCGEHMHHPISADKNGDIIMGLAPAVIGESGGICHMDILRDEGSIHIKLPWGEQKR